MLEEVIVFFSFFLRVYQNPMLPIWKLKCNLKTVGNLNARKNLGIRHEDLNAQSNVYFIMKRQVNCNRLRMLQHSRRRNDKQTSENLRETDCRITEELDAMANKKRQRLRGKEKDELLKSDTLWKTLTRGKGKGTFMLQNSDLRVMSRR